MLAWSPSGSNRGTNDIWCSEFLTEFLGWDREDGWWDTEKGTEAGQKANGSLGTQLGWTQWKKQRRRCKTWGMERRKICVSKSTWSKSTWCCTAPPQTPRSFDRCQWVVMDLSAEHQLGSQNRSHLGGVLLLGCKVLHWHSYTWNWFIQSLCTRLDSMYSEFLYR